jgi:choline dehydrogenase-like flavoprotein
MTSNAGERPVCLRFSADMLIDANELPENSRIDCDICVAGSGPAGITIAAELAGGPMQVCLLESGSLSNPGDVTASSVAEQIGVWVDLAKFEHHSFGGASNRWGGLRGQWFRSKPMDPIDFKPRSWVANSGWPIAYAELLPYFERAGRILGASSAGDFRPDVHQAHLAAEFHNDALQTAIFQMTRPIRFGKQYNSSLTGARNVRVLLHARVIEIEEDPDSSVISYFHIATPGGRAHRISAKHFVLSCGGLENPRLLLASKRKMATGIGNQRDLVGRYYMQHPKGLHGIAVLNRESVRAPLYTRGYLANDVRICGGICFSEEFQEREQVLNHCVMFRPVLSLSESHASEVYRAVRRTWHRSQGHPGGGRELMDLARSVASVLKQASNNPGLRTIFSVLNHMEQIPKPESRLDLSEQKDRFGVHQLRVDWRIDPLEKASLVRLHTLLRDRLARAGTGKLVSKLDPLAADWPVSHDSAHHIGTTRMHESREHGVTDPHCRVHGVENLYVGGSSVLPTSGYANPTLTVIALAIRLAEHLKSLYRLNVA